MQKPHSEETFRDVPAAQKEEWQAFRATHPPVKLPVQGYTWEYLISGQGEETLVLLTGGLNSGEVWFKIISAFEKTYRVIAVRYPNVATLAEVVEGVVAILDAEQVQRAHILGESLGGMVAQGLVRRYPDRVASMILASTAAPVETQAPRMKRLKLMVHLMPASVLRSLSVKRVLSLLVGMSADERAFWQAFLTEQVVLCSTKSWLISQYKLLVDYCEHYHFAPEDLAHWTGAILILAADDDQIVQRIAPGSLARYYPNASTHIFHEAGHSPLLTKRQEYIEVVQEFLRANQQAHASQS
ncbi:MAG: alpha/beta hydrolase [Chloroflexota bacterium]|nr:alpha/beta hydrolase [Chloroflexota bacterium]